MFTEVVLNTDSETADALSDALLDAGALAATVEDANAGSAAEEPRYGEPGSDALPRAWRASRVTALFEAAVDLAQALEAARAATGLVALPSYRLVAVPETDWVRLTQAQFVAQRVTARLWIVPSWQDIPAEAGADSIVVRLDPGLAFGTGSHPTTRLCLEWLAQNLRAGQSVIDYGCGSGILAIAARRLGAGRVLGTDIDPQALRAATENATINQVDIDWIPPDAVDTAGAAATVVLANILANPLQVLAPLLARLVLPRGSLVLSGILERQVEAVVAAYRPWFEMRVWASAAGWACLEGTRLASEAT